MINWCGLVFPCDSQTSYPFSKAFDALSCFLPPLLHFSLFLFSPPAHLLLLFFSPQMEMLLYKKF